MFFILILVLNLLYFFGLSEILILVFSEFCFIFVLEIFNESVIFLIILI